MVPSSIVHSNVIVTSKQLLFELRIFSENWTCVFYESQTNVRCMTGNALSQNISDKIVTECF